MGISAKSSVSGPGRFLARAKDLIGLGGYQGRASTYPNGQVLFDGKRFHNPYETPGDRIPDKRSYEKECKFVPWEKRTPRHFDPPPERVIGSAMRVTLVGHACLLLQTEGINLLTDPVWSDHVGPVPLMGNCRYQEMGIALEALPPIDLVAVSHDHYDHFDPPTLRFLARRDGPLFLVPLGNRELFPRHKIDGDVLELPMYKTKPLPVRKANSSIVITLVPARHHARRGLLDLNRRLWGGYVFDGGHGSAFFAGDTGYSAHIQDVRARFGRPRCTLFPIGGYEPRGLFSTIHMDPAEAVRAHREMDSPLSIAMHHATFRLTGEAQDQPVVDLQRALADSGTPAEEFRVLENGEGLAIPHV